MFSTVKRIYLNHIRQLSGSVSTMKDLSKVDRDELVRFLSSFDRVLSDVDGVLCWYDNILSGSVLGIQTLKALGKPVTFVSNNTTKTINTYHCQLLEAGLDIKEDDLITPTVAIIDFLKKNNFDKKIYLIGMNALREELEAAGFRVADQGPLTVNETFKDFITAVININDTEVGAVIADGDININYFKIQRAMIFLNDPNVIFITGAADMQVTFTLCQRQILILGPGYFHRILEDITGRKAHRLSKPSGQFNDFIVNKLGIEDPGRVLFIGDSIYEDMGFAAQSGYQKLLVLSGTTSPESIHKWEFPQEFKPDYFVQDMKTFHEIIAKHFFMN